MSTITGNWLLRMKTPVGTIEARYEFEDDHGVLTGRASDGDQSTALTELTTETVADGELVTWHQKITKPLRLNLSYEVTVTGDTLTGESRAGRLPRSRVTGERVRP